MSIVKKQSLLMTGIKKRTPLKAKIVPKPSTLDRIKEALEPKKNEFRELLDEIKERKPAVLKKKK